MCHLSENEVYVWVKQQLLIAQVLTLSSTNKRSIGKEGIMYPILAQESGEEAPLLGGTGSYIWHWSPCYMIQPMSQQAYKFNNREVWLQWFMVKEKQKQHLFSELRLFVGELWQCQINNFLLWQKSASNNTEEDSQLHQNSSCNALCVWQNLLQSTNQSAYT